MPSDIVQLRQALESPDPARPTPTTVSVHPVTIVTAPAPSSDAGQSTMQFLGNGQSHQGSSGGSSRRHHDPSAFAASNPTDADPAAVSALKGLLQEQSARMARMEAELDGARRTLQDRKIIERAKGALMSRLGMNEEAAFRMLQKASMDHNRKLVEVAEAMLALPEAVFNNQVRR